LLAAPAQISASGITALGSSSGIPASSRRSPSAAQFAGRYRALPIRACPAGTAYVKVTATWHRAMPPVAPQYWRAAPAQSAEDFLAEVSSTYAEVGISEPMPILELCRGARSVT
jgi:hypothetical protein